MRIGTYEDAWADGAGDVETGTARAAKAVLAAMEAEIAGVEQRFIRSLQVQHRAAQDVAGV